MDLKKQITTKIYDPKTDSLSATFISNEEEEGDQTLGSINCLLGEDIQSNPTYSGVSDPVILSSPSATNDGTSEGSPFSSSRAALGGPSTDAYVSLDEPSSSSALLGCTASVEDLDTLVSGFNETACGAAEMEVDEGPRGDRDGKMGTVTSTFSPEENGRSDEAHGTSLQYGAGESGASKRRHGPLGTNNMQQRITNFYKPGHRVENTQARTDQKTSNKDTIPAKSENFMDSLKVTQINLKRKAEAWGHLLGSLAGTKNPALLITEPPTDNEHQLTCAGDDMILFYCKLGQVRPRAAIMMHRSMKELCSEVKHLTSPDAVAVKVTLNGTNFIFASLYMDITQPVTSNIFTELSSMANENTRVYICADTNSHHVLWGNKDTNSRGEELLDILNTCNLSWANIGKVPTFFNSRGQQSVIDLTITNEGGHERIHNWHVAANKFSNSDHRYIQFDVKIKTQVERTKLRLTRHTNWDAYSKTLKSSVCKITKPDLNTPVEQLHSAAESLEHAIKTAFNYACPITYISNKIKKPPWLTPDVEQARHDVRRKLMLSRKTKSKADLDSLNACNKQYNKTLKKAKSNGWKKYCEATESLPESARMHNIIKSSKNRKEELTAVYDADGNLTSSPAETVDVMTSTHFPQDLEQEGSAPSMVEPADPDLLNKIYNPDRMKKAVFSFEPEKAPGPDGIQGIMLRKAWPAIGDLVQSIMIASHNKQCVPRPWRESSAIFLPKPGKKDYCEPKSFRTITLSPIFLKLQEKLILWHLQHDLGISDCISKKQFGFKSGCSTEAALHKVAHQIERRIAKKGYVLGTFLDIEGAFDNVSFAAIAEALNKTSIDKSTTQWIINMISNRYVTVKFKTTYKRIKIKRGCPQGGVLSPFLWNLVINDLLTYSSGNIPCHLQAFADDLISLAEGDDPSVIWHRTQKTIDHISNWCVSKGLKLSALKTKIVMFTWNRKWSIRPINVDGNIIELSPSAKLLGVTLDSKLNFSEHIDNITVKATKYLMQAKKAVGPTWGLTPKVCKWLYTTVVRPLLSYCVSVWVRALDNKCNAKKLERVQARALRIVSGAFPTTPFKALNHITETPDIIHYLRGEAAKGAIRLKGYGTWTKETPKSGKGIIRSHVSLNNTYIDGLNLPAHSTMDLMPPVMILDRGYTSNIPIEDINSYRQAIYQIIDSLDQAVISCYTDGSETESGTGGGFVITTNNNEEILYERSFKLPDYCSVFQAELTAITEAADYCSKNLNSRNIEFFSDSLSSLQSLQNTKANSKTSWRCHNALNLLASDNHVALNWVPAHTGLIWGNEKADALAKLGTTSTDLIKGHLPQSYIKKAINNRVANASKEDWIKDPHEHTNMVLGAHADKILTTMNRSMINSRLRYRTAVQLLTGHSALNKHLFRIKCTDSEICPKCLYDIEDVGHFLGRCPFYSKLRVEHFSDYYLTIHEILDNKTSINKIVDYAIKTRRFESAEDQDKQGVT